MLGHRGMLGSVVARYFAQQGARVLTTDLRFGDEMLEFAAGHVIVNCIRSTDAEIPRELDAIGTLIQPSTDAYREPEYTHKVRGEHGIVSRCGLVDVTRQPTCAFVNWTCNPLTPLEWAEWAWTVREPGVHYLGRETVSRFDIASAVADLWGRPQPNGSIAATPRDRTVPPQDRPPLRVALADFREWLLS